MADLTAGGAEVWTMNDWYRCYPWMTPHRLFNIHFAPHVTEGDPARFPCELVPHFEEVLGEDGPWVKKTVERIDWKDWYNHAIDSGCKVSVVEQIQGVSPDGQELVPLSLWDTFPRSAIVCSVSLGICLAASMGFERIELRGVRLRDVEYTDQLNGVLNAIRHARSVGVKEIINPYEEVWGQVAPPEPIDWQSAKDVNKGSLKNLVAYSLGLKLDPNSLKLTEADIKTYKRNKRKRK